MDRKRPAQEQDRQAQDGQGRGDAPPREWTRRDFLRAGGLVAVGTALAACGAPPQPEITVAEAIQPVEAPVLPSPAPSTPVAAGENAALTQFLALSRVLTGYDRLDPVVGQVYLDSLGRGGSGMSVDELARAAGLPGETPALADLEAAGLFEDPEAQELAQAILNMWYTGVYQNAEGEDQVATYVDALVWRALTFTKPLTICGSPGFWAQAPQQPFA